MHLNIWSITIEYTRMRFRLFFKSVIAAKTIDHSGNAGGPTTKELLDNLPPEVFEPTPEELRKYDIILSMFHFYVLYGFYIIEENYFRKKTGPV